MVPLEILQRCMMEYCSVNVLYLDFILTQDVILDQKWLKILKLSEIFEKEEDFITSYFGLV